MVYKLHLATALIMSFLGLAITQPGQAEAQQAGGNGSIAVSGELKQWHKVTLTLDGPRAAERDQQPNPFTDYRYTVAFAHESGSQKYNAPGYFAVDGDAANSSAEA